MADWISGVIPLGFRAVSCWNFSLSGLVTGLLTGAEKGDFGGGFKKVCRQFVDNFPKMRIVYKSPCKQLIFKLKTKKEFPKFNI